MNIRRGPIVDLFNQQSGLCVYCTRKMTLRLNKGHTATIDHIIPRSKGGVNHEDNYAAACSSCNTDKGSKDLIIFLIERIGGNIRCSDAFRNTTNDRVEYRRTIHHLQEKHIYQSRALMLGP